MRALLGTFFLMSAVAASAMGQVPQPASAPASNTWSNLQIPGQIEGWAHAAYLNVESADAARLPLEMIRNVHQVVNESPLVLRHIREYLSAVEAFSAERTAFGERPISLRLANDPVGRKQLEAFLRVVGLAYTKGFPPRVVKGEGPEVSRVRGYLADAGIKLQDLEDRLNSGEAISLEMPTTVVPLPMTVKWWQEHVESLREEPESRLFRDIILDKTAAYLYYGLASLDEPTREYLLSTPKLLKVFENHPPLFAAYGGSFRVRRGEVDVPGGRDAVGFWESLVGERITKPDRFIDVVLGADSGRLAYFYDLLAHLDPSRLKFALRQSVTPEKKLARDYAPSLYEWFNQEDIQWDPTKRPFTRPRLDPSFLLLQVDVDSQGNLKPPAWQGLWDVVFTRRDIPPPRANDSQFVSTPIDPVSLISAIFRDGNERAEDRLLAFLFAQRVFKSAPIQSAPLILTALRGFPRFHMLDLTLERAGVRSPAVYAAATRRAEALSEISNADAAVVALSQFQGSLALVTRAALSGRLSSDQVSALADSLSGIAFSQDGSYGAKIALWLDTQLIPAVGASPAADGSSTLEHRLLGGVLGVGTLVEPNPPDLTGGSLVEWEGWQYRIDAAAGRLDRALKVRARQAGNSLDSVIDLARVSGTLAENGIAVAGIGAPLDALKALRKGLNSPKVPTRLTDAEPLQLSRVLDESISDLERVIKEPKRLKDASRVADNLGLLTSVLAADVLRALTYAVAINEPDTPLLSAGDPSYQHDFGWAEQRLENRERAAWGLPREAGNELVSATATSRRSESWHVKGSLLGLDVALVPITMRHITAPVPGQVPFWALEDRDAYQMVVALFSPTDLPSPALIASAITRGRTRVQGLAEDQTDLAAIEDLASMGPLRRSLLAWRLQNRVGLLDAFSPSDLLRIGGAEESLQAAERWGAPAVPLNGCLCLTLGPSVDWEMFVGRGGAQGFLAARSPDLLLRLAEFMAALKLPGEVAQDILPIAALSALNEARPANVDDAWALVGYINGLSRRTVEDYVSSVTTGHSMVPVSAIIK